MEVLVELLERPGELVTRDDLRRRLWNDGTVTDFDVGLNTAVSRLRQVLNDPPVHRASLKPFRSADTDSSRPFKDNLPWQYCRS